MKVDLVKTLLFEAAHSNPQGTDAQQRLHGHSYRVDIVAEGAVESELGWLVDFGDIKRSFGPLYDQLDHGHLNELDGMGDTQLPGLRDWVLRKVGPSFPWLKDVRFSILGDCAFQPMDVPADERLGEPKRIRFGFEAAQYLPQLPPEHPCSRMHGHSYRLEVGARDMDRLKPHLEALYGALDHRCLNDVPGLNRATCEVMCQWIWERLASDVDDLTVVVVQETQSTRCAYFGD